MKVKRVRVVSPQGITTYADLMDIDGIVTIALAAYAEGQRSVRLVAFIEWLKTLERMPTANEFKVYMEARGTKFARINGTVQNMEN